LTASQLQDIKGFGTFKMRNCTLENKKFTKKILGGYYDKIKYIYNKI